MKKNTKRYVWAVPLVGLAVLAVSSASHPASGSAGPQNIQQNINTPPGESAIAPALTLSQATRGVVFKTAAINSDASVATCFRCSPSGTVHLGTGFYQVAFDENVQANNGWSRWVQADTLSTGSENAWCNTADRAGISDAIFVNCQTSGGAGSMGNSKPVDASFFLFVAR